MSDNGDTETMTMTMRSTHLWLLLAALAVALTPAMASAHGEEAVLNPEKGATVGKAPTEVFVDLTEAPTKDAQMVVKDACGETVSGAPSVDGQRLAAAIDGGVPGKWVVSYSIVSSVDGHPTKGGWTFTVNGKKDCSADEPSGNGGDKGNNGGNNGDQQAVPDPVVDKDEDGSSFPVVPVAAGTVALVAIALFIRARSGG